MCKIEFHILLRSLPPLLSLCTAYVNVLYRIYRVILIIMFINNIAGRCYIGYLQWVNEKKNYWGFSRILFSINKICYTITLHKLLHSSTRLRQKKNRREIRTVWQQQQQIITNTRRKLKLCEICEYMLNIVCTECLLFSCKSKGWRANAREIKWEATNIDEENERQ